MLLAAPLTLLAAEEPTDEINLSAGGSAAEPYEFSLLVGDQYRYLLSTNIAVTYSISSGDLSKIGLELAEDKISGVAKAGKELICITATAADGGPLRSAEQWIAYAVYNVLSLSGSAPTASWAGSAYSASFTITDVDPDREGETVLTLNEEAVTAGYQLSQTSETSYTLSRSAEKNVSGTVEVMVTAATAAGGISQSKTASATISTYSRVGITSLPEDHQGSGLTVWLIEDESVWQYRPTAVPADAALTVSGLNDAMKWQDGVLSVERNNVFDSVKIKITATSSAGGSLETAQQELTIRNWNKVVFASAPSLSDILTTVDGRTVHAAVKADNYNYIQWKLSDGTVYENVTSIEHTFAQETEGPQEIRVLVRDEVGREKAAQVSFNLENKEETPSEETPYFWLLLVIGIVAVILGLLNKPHWLLTVLGGALIVVALGSGAGVL